MTPMWLPWGELWQGGGRGYKNMVMITLGTGVGGGIILNEKIWSGMQGVGGEIGHIHVIEGGDGDRCNCGGYGCLEQAASATGIARLARKLLEADPARPSSLREVKNLSAKSVLDAARAGDPLALESVETSCRYLGWAMAGITMVVDPEAYLIGGGVSRAGTFLTEKDPEIPRPVIAHGHKEGKRFSWLHWETMRGSMGLRSWYWDKMRRPRLRQPGQL